jgi:hypothetical protein
MTESNPYIIPRNTLSSRPTNQCSTQMVMAKGSQTSNPARRYFLTGSFMVWGSQKIGAINQRNGAGSRR